MKPQSLDSEDKDSVVRDMAIAPLYRRLLGAGFDHLPEPLRALHDLQGQSLYEGRAEVTRGPNPLARLIAGLLGLPEEGQDVPVTVEFRRDGIGEIWTRNFGNRRFATQLRPVPNTDGGKLSERFGPFALTMDLVPRSDGLELVPLHFTAFGLPIPRWLAIRSTAREVVRAGRYGFDVTIDLPVLGRLVGYRGWLEPVETPTDCAGRADVVMLFDGVCNLCSGAVSFLIRHDREGRVRFAAMQSTPGQKLLRELALPLTDFETVAVLADGRLYTESDAVLRLAAELPRPWRWLASLRIVPQTLRDRAYLWVARNRYRFLGRRSVCFAPDAETRDRFLI